MNVIIVVMFPCNDARHPHNQPFVALRQNVQHLQAFPQFSDALQDLLPRIRSEVLTSACAPGTFTRKIRGNLAGLFLHDLVGVLKKELGGDKRNDHHRLQVSRGRDMSRRR